MTETNYPQENLSFELKAQETEQPDESFNADEAQPVAVYRSEIDETAGESEQAIGEIYVISGLWRRFIAFGLDLAALGIVGSVLGLIIPSLAGGGWLIDLIFVNSLCLGLIGCLYFILMTRFTGQTLGKMIMGIRVVRLDGAELDWSTVIWRELVGRSLSQLLGTYLGYLVALFTDRKQAPHDLIVDTCVIYDRRGHSPLEIMLPAA